MVDLVDIKEHLIIEHDLDDKMLLQHLSSARSYLTSVGVDLANPDAQPSLNHAIKLMVSGWYTARDFGAEKPYVEHAFGVSVLIAPLRKHVG